MKKKLFAAGLFAVAVIGATQLLSTTPAAARINCSQVRCAGCPDGQHLAPTPGNCCRCLPN